MAMANGLNSLGGWLIQYKFRLIDAVCCNVVVGHLLS